MQSPHPFALASIDQEQRHMLMTTAYKFVQISPIPDAATHYATFRVGEKDTVGGCDNPAGFFGKDAYPPPLRTYQNLSYP
jgi:hypothetical protein